jgi:uncharacterized protein with HEPN domain
MQPRDASYLFDILDAARSARDFVAGYDEDSFVADRKTQSAVIRELLIIGEATKQVSPAYRDAHPEIPWRAMAGMRDVLVHNYRGTSLENVWIAATESLPSLIAALEPLFPPEDIRIIETRSDDA